MTETPVWTDGQHLPDNSPLLVLAHGAGAPADTPFMGQLASALADRGIRVRRFEFAYMAGRRSGAKKRPPPKAEKLIVEFAAQLDALQDQQGPLFIGGKSMGGRVASLLLAHGYQGARPPRAALGFGYPFHAPGKPPGARLDHLAKTEQPVFIAQGTRDPFGKPEEVAGFQLPQNVHCHWLQSADHDYHPLKRSGANQQQIIAEAAQNAADFILAECGGEQ